MSTIRAPGGSRWVCVRMYSPRSHSLASSRVCEVRRRAGRKQTAAAAAAAAGTQGDHSILCNTVVSCRQGMIR